MTRAAVDTGVTMIRGFAIAIIRDGKVPVDWEQAMKVIEKIAYSLVKQVMTIDWGTLGGPLCRWHCHYCILYGRICP